MVHENRGEPRRNRSSRILRVCVRQSCNSSPNVQEPTRLITIEFTFTEVVYEVPDPDVTALELSVQDPVATCALLVFELIRTEMSKLPCDTCPVPEARLILAYAHPTKLSPAHGCLHRRGSHWSRILVLIGRNVAELVDLPKGQPGHPSRAMTEEQASKVL